MQNKIRNTIDQDSRVSLYSSDAGLLLLYKKLPTLEECLDRAGVLPESYGCRLVQRMHNYMFGNVLDLKREYSMYYSKEYDSMESFFYHKMIMSKQDIDSIKYAIQSEYCIGHVTNKRWKVDWSMRDLLDEERFGMQAEFMKVLNTIWIEVDTDED